MTVLKNFSLQQEYERESKKSSVIQTAPQSYYYSAAYVEWLETKLNEARQQQAARVKDFDWQGILSKLEKAYLQKQTADDFDRAMYVAVHALLWDKISG